MICLSFFLSDNNNVVKFVADFVEWVGFVEVHELLALGFDFAVVALEE